MIVWGHFHDYGFLYLYVLPVYLLAKALLRAGLLTEEGYVAVVIFLLLVAFFYCMCLEIWYYAHFWTHFWGALINWLFSSVRGCDTHLYTLAQ